MPKVKKKNEFSMEDETISIGNLIIVIARNLKLIVTTLFLSVLASLFWSFIILNPVYESESKIMSSNTNRSSAQSIGGLAAQFGISFPSSNNGPNWVYSEIIRSRILSKKLLSREFESEIKGKKKPLLEILTRDYDTSKQNPKTLHSVAIMRLQEMIYLVEDRKTKIHTIKIRSVKPDFATKLNFALIEELEMHQKDYNKKKMNQTRAFIEVRINSTEKELNLSEEKLKDFRDRNRRIENSPGLLLEQERLSREVSVLTSVFTTLKQQLETTKIEEVKESSYVVIVDPPSEPIFPISPKKKRILLMSILIGLSIGIGISFIGEYFRKLDSSEKDKIKEAKVLFFKIIKKSTLLYREK